MFNENETLVDIVIKNGQLFKKLLKNGKEILEPVEEDVERDTTNDFADTSTVPAPWKDADTEILMPKNKGHKVLTRSQHVDRSLRLEAVLVKALGPKMRGSDMETIDLGGNSALKELLLDLCQASGGEWSKVAKRIK